MQAGGELHTCIIQLGAVLSTVTERQPAPTCLNRLPPQSGPVPRQARGRIDIAQREECAAEQPQCLRGRVADATLAKTIKSDLYVGNECIPVLVLAFAIEGLR